MFIKRLEHSAKEMDGAILGWDIFRCRDYDGLDGMANQSMQMDDFRKLKPILGYTIIIAFNFKRIKFLKRFFLRTTRR